MDSSVTIEKCWLGHLAHWHPNDYHTNSTLRGIQFIIMVHYSCSSYWFLDGCCWICDSYGRARIYRNEVATHQTSGTVGVPHG